MKLYFMKQNAIDFLKANMRTLYMHYYRFDTNEWLYDLFDYDPFEFFMEVPDFELAPIGSSTGEAEFENSKILYMNLRLLSESQASDERLWAGLCNGIFYKYLRARWKYSTTRPKEPKKDASLIISRFFYLGGTRAGMFRNSLARNWWVGRLTYDQDNTNHWFYLNLLGAEDYISKVSDLFYSNTFSASPEILKGICKGLEYFRDRNQKILVRDHLRPTMQYLNAVGGGILLDSLSVDEIAALVVENIGRIIKGDQGDFFEEIGPEPDEINEEAVNDNATEVDIDYTDSSEETEMSVEDIDPDQIFGVPTEVQRGCTVRVLNKTKQTEMQYTIPVEGGERELNLLEQRILGKHVGDVVRVKVTDYEVLSIRW